MKKVIDFNREMTCFRNKIFCGPAGAVLGMAGMVRT